MEEEKDNKPISPEPSGNGGITANSLGFIPSHTHNDVDSPRLDPRFFKGFQVSSSVPTDSAEEGTLRLGYVSGLPYIFARENNAWQSFTPFVSTNQLVETFDKADSNIGVDDIVSLIEGGSTDFFIIDLGDSDRELGKQSNPDRAACSFTAPFSMTGFTCKVWVKEIGSSTSDVDVKLCSSSGGPSTVIETQTISNTLITSSYQQFSVTFTSTISAGTSYWITIEKQGSLSLTNYYVTKVPQAWRLYSSGAVYNGTSWTTDSQPLNITLTKTVTAGLYRTVDVPNNMGMQGGVKGVVKTVNSTTCDVVVSGKHTASSSLFTAGQDYFCASTAGDFSTSGTTLIGRAVSATVIDVNSKKTQFKRYSSNFESSTSNLTITIMTGFRAVEISSVSLGSTYASVGNLGYVVKMKSGVNPGSGSVFFDTDDSGGGTSGGYVDSYTINKSNVSIVFKSNAATKRWQGEMTFTL